MLGNAAMTCRYWQRLFSPFQWKYTELERATSVHRLEEIISSPLSRRLKDNLRELSLFPYSNPHSDIESDRFFSAWRSLSRHLHPITHLDIWGSSQRYALKSYPIRLRPLPQHCLHIQTLDLQYITFPSFSALFRDVGALLFLERLILNGIRWGGVCDPHFPPMSAATFSAIKSVFASDCTDGGWPLAWMFTTAVLRYGRPWRALDDAEAARTRSVRLDTCAVVQAVRWMLSGRGLPTESLRLTIVPALPKGTRPSSIDAHAHAERPRGPTRMISQLSSILHGSNVALGFTITAPDSTASGPSEGAHGSLVGLVVCRKTRDPVEPWDKLDGALSGVAHPLAVDVLSWGTVSEDAEAYIQTRMPSATVRLHAVPGDKQLLNEGAIVEFWKRMDSAGATASRTRS